MTNKIKKSNNFISYSLILTLLLTITYKVSQNSAISDPTEDAVNFDITGKAKIIDGDSIRIKNHEIRIKSIDAPELYQTCYTNEQKEYACGKLAKDHLQQLTLNKIITCKTEDIDVYNRYLANCFIDNADIAINMLTNGWAVIYQMPSELYKYQEAARTNKAGIWQGEFTYPKIWRKMHPRK